MTVRVALHLPLGIDCHGVGLPDRVLLSLRSRRGVPGCWLAPAPWGPRVDLLPRGPDCYLRV